MTQRSNTALLVLLFTALVSSAATASAKDAIAWRTNLDAAKIEAAQTNRLVLLHFYTKSCGPCRMLDKNVFSQPQVAQSIEKNYVPVKVDAETSPALRGAFRIERVPTEVIITPQGNQVASMGSPAKSNDYVDRLTQVANHFRQSNEQLAQKTQLPPAHMNNAYAALPVTRAGSASQPSDSQLHSAANQPAPYQQPAAGVTNNPYVAASKPVPAQAARAQQAPAASPTVGDRYANSPAQAPPQAVSQQLAAPAAVVVATQPTRPQMPSNAMPQSYQNPYAVASQPTAPAAVAAPTQTQAAVVAVVPPANTRDDVPPQVAVVPTTPRKPLSHFVDNQVTPTADNIITPTTESGLASSTAAAPGTAPLGFDGFCPVTLKNANKWVEGRVEHGLVHRDRLYLFAGEKERQEFYTNPDAYSPVFSGCDPVLMLDKQQSVPGSREFGYRHKGAFYLFANKLTMQKFAQNKDVYSASVRQAMTRIDSLNDGGTIRR